MMDPPRQNIEELLDQYRETNEDDEVASMSFEEANDTGAPGPSASYSSVSFQQSTASTAAATSSNFYCENYFDLNDILSQANRVSVNFNRTIPKLGFLDPGAEDDKLLKGTKLEMPLWAVKELAADQVVNITVPKGYNNTYREILEADPNCVNLNKLGPNYYQFGQHLSTMNLAESEDIANCMIDTFAQRYHRLVNFALSGSNVGGTSESSGSSSLTKTATKSTTAGLKTSTSAGDDINTLPDLLTYTNSLDNWEKQLLTIGQATARQLKRWQNRDLAKVQANEMVTNLHKRKRLVDQHMQFQTLNGGQGVNGRSSPGPLRSSGPQSAFK